MALSLAINVPPVRDNLLRPQLFQSQFRPNLVKFPAPSSARIRCSSSSSSFNDISLKTVTPNRNNSFACRATPFKGRRTQVKVQESDKPYAETYAVGRHIRMSADKARRVIDQIRGRPYLEAVLILDYIPYRAREAILKIVRSVGANAVHNLGLSMPSLVISGAEVNEGKTLKRVRARAQGRANQILKRTCHITVKVRGLPDEAVVEAKTS
ncbi:large ribosomal subunit protein uL22c-like [Vicia villosa]|uniref:large ribosomal subunit protein uL22c-like n=1 Tax=Vicia villosa TaxID=3911 RepID=UPI00273ABCEE|nr:large ribosomal subunit protein uL22c-like [Vicia villosa]